MGPDGLGILIDEAEQAEWTDGSAGKQPPADDGHAEGPVRGRREKTFRCGQSTCRCFGICHGAGFPGVEETGTVGARLQFGHSARPLTWHADNMACRCRKASHRVNVGSFDVIGAGVKAECTRHDIQRLHGYVAKPGSALSIHLSSVTHRACDRIVTFVDGFVTIRRVFDTSKKPTKADVQRCPAFHYILSVSR